MKTNSVGQIPPITVSVPRDFPLAKLARFAEEHGYKIRWIPPDLTRLFIRRAQDERTE